MFELKIEDLPEWGGLDMPLYKHSVLFDQRMMMEV